MTWEPGKDFWRHRKVAVTGGTGFLGSHVVSQLCALDADVLVVVRDEIPLGPVHERWWSAVTRVRGDVSDQQSMERALGESEAQTVFHLAAQTQVGVANFNPISSFESNIRGTWTVLEAIRRSPSVQQVVVASSDKAYGNQPELPYTETMPLSAVNPYDVSKAAGEMIATSYARTYGVKVAITRCGNLYGPGDTNWKRLFPGVIRQLLEGERPVIRSDGTLTRDYLYVEDAASCNLLLAEALAGHPGLAGEAFNFAVGASPERARGRGPRAGRRRHVARARRQGDGVGRDLPPVPVVREGACGTRMAARVLLRRRARPHRRLVPGRAGEMT